MVTTTFEAPAVLPSRASGGDALRPQTPAQACPADAAPAAAATTAGGPPQPSRKQWLIMPTARVDTRVLRSLRMLSRHVLTGSRNRMLPLRLLSFDAEDFDPAAFEACGILLPPSVERGVRKRQADFFYGRLAAREALSDFGIGHVDLPIGGSREPLWPDEVVGSISHTDGLAASVVLARADADGVGIDVERVVADRSVPALIAGVVDPEELALIQALGTGLSINELLTVVFSAKESFFKAVFPSVRRHFGFDAARVVSLDMAQRRLTLQLSQTLCPGYEAGVACPVDFTFLWDGFLLTSCISTAAGRCRMAAHPRH